MLPVCQNTPFTPRHLRFDIARFLTLATYKGETYSSRQFQAIFIPHLFYHPPNMGEPSRPKSPRLTSIQYDSNLAGTPSHLASYYSSFANTSDAKANLKTILSTRVSFNDPNIIDVVIEPDEFSDHFVKTIKEYTLKDQVILAFLTHVRRQAFDFDSDMYKPLVGRNCYPYFEYS